MSRFNLTYGQCFKTIERKLCGRVFLYANCHTFPTAVFWRGMLTSCIFSYTYVSSIVSICYTFIPFLWEFSLPWYANEKDNWILRASSPMSSKEGWAIQIFPTLIFYFDHSNSFLLLSVSHKILFSLTQAPEWRDINIYHSTWRGQRTRRSLIIVLQSFLVNELHRALMRHIKV